MAVVLDTAGILQISVVQVDGEVHLVYRGHSFAICKTLGDIHRIQIYDIDSDAATYEADIQTLSLPR